MPVCMGSHADAGEVAGPSAALRELTAPRKQATPLKDKVTGGGVGLWICSLVEVWA